MSLGAQMAGVDVVLAVEKDSHAAQTYRRNHPQTELIETSIEEVKSIDVPKTDRTSILFGGPPCQGFSTSNQRTRTRQNISNWLFEEFIRIADLWKPDCVVIENVKGIVETEKGLFPQRILCDLEKIGYSCSWGLLSAVDFGVPQRRSRFFLIGTLSGKKIRMPRPLNNGKSITVREAIGDLPVLNNGANKNEMPYPTEPVSTYAKFMRNGSTTSTGHLVTRNAQYVVDRYKHIEQGENWESIPEALMNNYRDRSRCHTGIYKRLRETEPSVVIGNYRKNMLIHPWSDRGLSVREAARLQSFPDSYEFCGSVGFQQQQVGNAVPPLLAKAVFESILSHV